MGVKTSRSPLFTDFTVEQVNELNLFDLDGSRAGTKGTSNKMYHIELQVEKGGKGRVQLFSIFGPTGKAQRSDWRYPFGSRADAEKELERILKSKRKKGYNDIDVGSRAFGSTEAKAITKKVNFRNADHLQKVAKSALDAGQQRIAEIFFGAQQHFVAETLDCPLGQLSEIQIDEGRRCLDAAKKIVNAAKGSLSARDRKKLLEWTNQFYGKIPHNLGAGARGQMEHLLLDDITKIMGKEDDLDTLLDAKRASVVLKTDSTVDAKYKALNCDFTQLDKNDPVYKFLADYYTRSQVRGHGKGGTRVVAIWKMLRKDAKEKAFLANAERIAKACGKHTFVQEARRLSGGAASDWIPSKRPDLDATQRKLYDAANVWLCWHGTRSANLVGITTRGLLIRPSGAVHTGSMFGDGKYFAWQSSKSLNYCDGGYWTGGRSNDSKFMFLLDVAFGKMHKASHSHFFSKPPSGCHSVYGKAGSGLWNDEMITYDMDDKDNQSAMCYLFEIR
jgi:poly [ADP-ribose] polymerase